MPKKENQSVFFALKRFLTHVKNKPIPANSAIPVSEKPIPICSKEHTGVACKINEECRLKNPSEENCVAGGACYHDSRIIMVFMQTKNFRVIILL